MSPAVAESVVSKSVEQAVAQPLTLPEAVAEPKQDAEEGFTLEFSSAAGLEPKENPEQKPACSWLLKDSIYD